MDLKGEIRIARSAACPGRGRPVYPNLRWLRSLSFKLMNSHGTLPWPTLKWGGWTARRRSCRRRAFPFHAESCQKPHKSCVTGLWPSPTSRLMMDEARCWLGVSSTFAMPRSAPQTRPASAPHSGFGPQRARETSRAARFNRVSSRVVRCGRHPSAPRAARSA